MSKSNESLIFKVIKISVLLPFYIIKKMFKILYFRSEELIDMNFLRDLVINKREKSFIEKYFSKEQIERMWKDYNEESYRFNKYRIAKERKNLEVNFEQFNYLSKNEIENIFKEENVSIFEGNEFLNNKKIDNCIYPNEMIFLKFLNGKDKDEYISSHWRSVELILNAQKVKKKLLDNAYLTIENSKEGTLNLLTIPVLKEILRSNNLKLVGKKQDLINRIIDNNIDVETKPIYKLTEKGENIISQNDFYFKAKKYGVSTNDFQKYNFNEVEKYLDIKIKEAWGENWLTVRYSYLMLYKLNKNPKDKLNVLIIDISGLSDGNVLDTPELLFLSDLTLQEIDDILKKYDEYIENSIYDELSFKYLTKEEIKELLEKKYTEYKDSRGK